MGAALSDLITSKKFLAAIIGMLATVLAKKGIQLDTDATVLAISPILSYIVSQGIADHGKEAAKITAAANDNASQAPAAATAQGGFAALGLMLLLAFGAGIMVMSSGCGAAAKLGHDVAGAFNDCTKGEASELVKVFGPTVSDAIAHATDPATRKVDLERVKALGGGYLEAKSACVFADAVSRWLAPASGQGFEGPAIDRAQLAADFETYRKAAGLAEFHTANGAKL